METGLDLKTICDKFSMKDIDIRTISPLVLAYVGDAVYEMVIRSLVVLKGNRPVNRLNQMKVRFVNAKTQAEFIEALMDELTEDEQSAYRRGRNANPHSKAKNATAEEYFKATGFEAVMGYLYLTGQENRILELIKRAMELKNMEI